MEVENIYQLNYSVLDSLMQTLRALLTERGERQFLIL